MTDSWPDGSPFTEEDRIVRGYHEPVARLVFDAIDSRRPLVEEPWSTLDDLANLLDRLVTRGMHPDDRARAAEAMQLLAGLWLSEGELEALNERTHDRLHTDG